MDSEIMDAERRLRELKARKGELPYVVIRCQAAGVHCGSLWAREGREVILHDARRIWHWDGANTLHDVANFGPSVAKMPAPIARIELLDAIEVLYATEAGAARLKGIEAWVR